MPKGMNRFRAKYGVSPDQHYILSRLMKNETITRAQLGNHAASQLHRLVDRGIMIHIPSTTDKTTDDSWRLTEAGRNLLKKW
jgi:hypothetical protein